jgi:hypothetical protein
MGKTRAQVYLLAPCLPARLRPAQPEHAAWRMWHGRAGRDTRSGGFHEGGDGRGRGGVAVGSRDHGITGSRDHGITGSSEVRRSAGLGVVASSSSGSDGTESAPARLDSSHRSARLPGGCMGAAPLKGADCSYCGRECSGRARNLSDALMPSPCPSMAFSKPPWLVPQGTISPQQQSRFNTATSPVHATPRRHPRVCHMAKISFGREF